jgi:hypothetical protein
MYEKASQPGRAKSATGISSFAKTILLTCIVLASLGGRVSATENVPHRPFAMWADVPLKGQFIAGLIYEESESYHIYAGSEYHNVAVRANGNESYGIDINQGYVALQYGFTERWAADLNVGFTTSGWRYFNSTNGLVQDTTGLMDISFGIRYQIWNELRDTNCWLPTTTFRAGGVIPGSFSQELPFAPGTRSAAIEPELLFRKHFGWPGFGMYGDALFRWNKTTHNDQYIVSAGFFQQIKGWELQAGYRHLQSVDGSDIVLNTTTHDIFYPRDVREINDAIEAGVSYTTPKRQIRLAFHTRIVVDGSNTDAKFWVGGSIDMPFGGKHED